MTGKRRDVHLETTAMKKTSELTGSSWVKDRKIDDLMEMWRQWAGRRGIREAGGESQDEIR